MALDRFDPMLAFFIRPVAFALIPIMLILPKDTKYVILLEGIKNYRPYVKIFPEWKNVTKEDWLTLCHYFEKYTIEPWDNYEVLILEGALFFKLFPLASQLFPA